MRRIFRPCFKILFQRNFSRLCSVVSFSESLLTCCMFQDVSYSQFICFAPFRMYPTASLFVSRLSGCVLQPVYLRHVFQDASYSQFICFTCFRMCPTANLFASRVSGCVLQPIYLFDVFQDVSYSQFLVPTRGRVLKKVATYDSQQLGPIAENAPSDADVTGRCLHVSV